MTDTELNERLLKKIGFTATERRDGVCLWTEPNGKYWSLLSNADGSGNIPDLPNDLAACFKWLVPELRKRGCEVVSFYYNLKNIDCDLSPAGSSCATIEASAETESMALCLAADKFLR